MNGDNNHSSDSISMTIMVGVVRVAKAFYSGALLNHNENTIRNAKRCIQIDLYNSHCSNAVRITPDSVMLAVI